MIDDVKGISILNRQAKKSIFYMLSLDIVITAIEKLMAILVRGWSRADYLLEYSVNSNTL